MVEWLLINITIITEKCLNLIKQIIWMNYICYVYIYKIIIWKYNSSDKRKLYLIIKYKCIYK